MHSDNKATSYNKYYVNQTRIIASRALLEASLPNWYHVLFEFPPCFHASEIPTLAWKTRHQSTETPIFCPCFPTFRKRHQGKFPPKNTLCMHRNRVESPGLLRFTIDTVEPFLSLEHQVPSHQSDLIADRYREPCTGSPHKPDPCTGRAQEKTASSIESL